MSTGYPASMRKDCVDILNRKKAATSDFGIDGNGIEWEETGSVWANVGWSKGMRALNAGAIDVYSVVEVRMNWNCMIPMRSRIRHEGQVYQILPDTYRSDKQEKKIQFLAQAVINEQ